MSKIDIDNEKYNSWLILFEKEDTKESKKIHCIYEKCAKLKSMQRCLRPGGRLVLRDVTSDNKLLLWFMDKIELPLANLCGHGDVKIATRGLIADCCKQVVKCFDEKHGVKCA